MIINLNGKQRNDGQIEITMPSVRLDHRCLFKIGLHHINFKLANTARNNGLEDNELISLNTNLIDRSALNTSQSIVLFPFNIKRKSWQNFRGPIVVYNPLQLYEFENVSFELKKYFTEEQIDIESIFIQLEIAKYSPYGRVQ